MLHAARVALTQCNTPTQRSHTAHSVQHTPLTTNHTAAFFAGVGDACGSVSCREQACSAAPRTAAHRRSTSTEVALVPALPSCTVGGRPSSAPAAAAAAARCAGRSGRAARWCIAHHLLGLPRCAGVWVGALVHWYSRRGACGRVTKARAWAVRMGARAITVAQSVPPELTLPSRQRSARSGPLLAHAERAALVWRCAAKRWSIGRAIGHRSVARPSREHRGRLPRPGAALERPDRPATSATETPVGGRRRASLGTSGWALY